MSTRQNVLSAFAYYIGNGGYYEKASARNLSREVSDFSANKGSGANMIVTINEPIE